MIAVALVMVGALVLLVRRAYVDLGAISASLVTKQETPRMTVREASVPILNPIMADEDGCSTECA